VRLIFREDCAQVRLAEDQRPAEDFAAQGADCSPALRMPTKASLVVPM
jgi:hypothetical protein